MGRHFKHPPEMRAAIVADYGKRTCDALAIEHDIPRGSVISIWRLERAAGRLTKPLGGTRSFSKVHHLRGAIPEAPSASPCRFGGGNDGVTCLTCDIGYDPCRGEEKPPCGAFARIEGLKADWREMRGRAEAADKRVAALEEAALSVLNYANGHSGVLFREALDDLRAARAAAGDRT